MFASQKKKQMLLFNVSLTRLKIDYGDTGNTKQRGMGEVPCRVQRQDVFAVLGLGRISRNDAREGVAFWGFFRQRRTRRRRGADCRCVGSESCGKEGNLFAGSARSRHAKSEIR